MSKGPLFSTYRQGENRVTASMLAVFERIDLALLERLLGAASGESELQMVSFTNQAAGDKSVPDASIEANFRYLFEVKTEREWVDADQLHRHLTSLTGDANRHLFVITPDLDEPEDVRSLRVEDAPVSWFSFAQLADAIRRALGDPTILIFQREEFLLRELIRLFDDDGLLDPVADTIIVPGVNAHTFYQRYGLYNRDPERSIRRHVRYLGFSPSKAIQREVPRIRERYDCIGISREKATQLARSSDANERAVGEALLRAIDDGHFGSGMEQQVFLLSKFDDSETIMLPRPIKIPGAPWQNQRYVSSEALRAGPETTEELGK